MTKQEIFNIVYLGLQAQGWKRSMSKNSDVCLYRAPDGCKCAVGHLITDEEYDEGMEFQTINSLVTKKRLDRFRPHLPFLRLLQDLHDFESRDDTLEQDMKNFARSFGLEIPNAV